MTNTDNAKKQLWICLAYDSGNRFVLADSPEAAQAEFIKQHFEPETGFSVIKNRTDYKRELGRVSAAMGFDGLSIPAYAMPSWIIVARLAERAAEVVLADASTSQLGLDWRGVEFYIEALAGAKTNAELKAEREAVRAIRQAARGEHLEALANLVQCSGFVSQPSDRQRAWAKESPTDWLVEMSDAHYEGKIQLTLAEASFARECNARLAPGITGITGQRLFGQLAYNSVK